MKRSSLAMLGIFLLAFILRALYLGDKSVWLDEATSVFLARSGPAAALASDLHAILYYRLLSLWLRLGDSEAAIRSLSVLWSVATVPVVFALGRHLYGIREGITAALLLAVNAFHIAYAQEARSYSQAVFVVSLASLLFLRAVERPTARHWAAYTVATLLAIFSHGYAVLIVGAHLASLVFMRPADVPWRSVALSLGAVALLAVPSLAVAATFGARGAGWIPPTGARDVYDMLRSLAGLADVPLLLAYALALFLGLAEAARTWTAAQASPASFRYGLPVAWFAVPLLVAYAASSFIPVLPRYLMLSLPGLALIAAAGIARIRPAALSALALAVTVALAANGVRSYYCCVAKEDWRAATAAVLSHARAGDAILFYSPYVQPAFDYYRARQAGSHAAPPPQVVPDPDHLAAMQPRAWLVVSHDETVEHTASRGMHDALARRYGSSTEWRFTGVTVFLFPGAAGP